MINKGYCEECNKLVEYNKKEIDSIIEIKGKKYNYKRIVGYCKDCGEEISSNEINDQNLNSLKIVYGYLDNMKILKKMYSRRLKGYKIAGYEIIE